MSIDELRKLCDAATPGPWVCDDCGDVFSTSVSEYMPELDCDNNKHIGTTRFYTRENIDAKFIAAARTYMPKLIAVAEAAREADHLLECSPFGMALLHVLEELGL